MVRGLVDVIAVGALVAGAVWFGLIPGGRRVGEVLRGGPGRGVVRGAQRRVAAGAVPGRPDAAPRATGGPDLAAVAAGDEPLRVLVLQVVALLRSGAPPGVAWSRAAGVPVSPAGVPDDVALARVLGARHARAVAAATRLALDVGAPLGQVLESVAGTLVAEAEAAAEREAALAGPRTTARVLLWLPALGVVLGWALGADPVATAIGGGPGTVSIVAGVLLLLVGRTWTGRLVAVARGVREATVEVPVVLELVAAAMRAGAGVPRALRAAGTAVGSDEGAGLVRAADALVLGAGWDTAWSGTPSALDPVRRALRGAWVDGAAPADSLRAAGEELRHVRQAAARTAAARLAVRLVLPLGACYLPAFVLVGLVPVLLALGVGLVGS
ncbi:type II secretion system F family protein [Antribacter gilvus]|uniref:type II secretion system F family protein n=1 Tax=Antribacter gilvus TaxID=2304675 RepID=UPI001F0C6F1B|nr:type II secretion system F family protein [Antribacter gilvus]